MVLPDLAIERPRTLDAAIRLLERFGDDAAFYMGGTELLLLMKLGMAEATLLIDGKRLAELQRLDRVDGTVRIGAGRTHRDIERAPIVNTALPALADMAKKIANLRVRNVGTLGGNLCFAEPHSDPATLLMALGARVRLASSAGERSMPVEEFVLGPLTTALGEGEVLTEVHVPTPQASDAVAYERIKFRERPVVNVAILRDHRTPRLVVGAVGPQPTRVPEAEELLAQDSIDVPAVCAAVMDAVDPVPDADGEKEYKRHLTQIATKRALSRLLEPGTSPT